MEQNNLLKLKIVCIFLFCISFGMAAIILTALAKLYLLKEYDSVLDPMPLITIIAFLLIGIFQLKCFNLVANKYPDKELTHRNDSAFSLLFIFSSIVFLGIFICYVGFVFSLLNERASEGNGNVFYYLLIAFTIYIPSHIFCMRLSFALRKIIKINYYQSQNKMIDMIGKEHENGEDI